MRMFLQVFTVSLFLTGSLTSPIYAQEQKKLISSPDIIPPATEEMQHPEYWISRIDGDPDRVIMTPEQINELNMKNRSRSLEKMDINGETYSLTHLNERFYHGLQFHFGDPLTMKPVPGDSLRNGIKRGQDYIAKRELYDRRWIPYTDAMKQEIIDSMDLDSIPATVKPRYGIICTHTLNRRVPTYQRAYGSQYGWLDLFQMGAFETGMPVAILHTTKDCDWYYVRSEFSFRWIPAANVAEGSVRNIRRLSEPEDFIVALAHKVPVYADRTFKIWITDFYQGARLALKNKTAGGYKVLVPYREENGSLEAVTGWVKPDAGVSVGFQPFTQRNIINTIFKLLYHPYGWGDSEHERDCCGIVRTVLDTFGIFTPRAPTHQFHYTDHVYIFPKETPKEEKYRIFDSCEPGITICGFSGHIMMYLGKVDDSYYVVHSNGYSYHDEEGTEIRVARTSVTDLELGGGSDIEKFTEIATFKP